MFGKIPILTKKLFSLIVLSILVFSAIGCQHNQNTQFTERIDEALAFNYDEESLVTINDTNAYFELKMDTTKTVHDFESIKTDELLSNSESYMFPKEFEFKPNGLNDNGILFGEAVRLSDSSDRYLASFDLVANDFKLLKNVENKENYIVIGIVNVSNDYVIFQEYDYTLATAYYYLYDLNHETVKEFYRIENLNALHYNTAFFSKDFILLNLADPETLTYQSMYYSVQDGKIVKFEQESSKAPIFYKGICYYIRIDNENAKTQLVAFDFVKNTKEVLYETTDNDVFMTGLYTNNEQLYMLLYNKDVYQFYEVDIDKRTLSYYFEGNWIESVNFKNNYLTWLGDSYTEGRNRSQYYLFDVKQNINYLHEQASIRLSTTGIAWVQYLRPENEIGKGQTFINGNSEIRYKIFD